MKISREVQIGAALLLSIATFYFGQRFLRDLPIFSGTHTYVTATSDASGIVPGNVIRIKGVNVGSVSDVQIAGGEALVSFTLQDHVRLPHGTTAILGGFSFVGDVRIDLVLGSPDTTYHEPGDRIPENQEAGLLENISASAPGLLAQLNGLLENTQSSVGTVRTMLDDPGSDFRRTMQSIGTAAQSFSELLDAEAEQIGAMLEDARKLANALTVLAEDSLTHTVGDLNDTIVHLNKTLDAIDRTVLAIDLFVERINSGQGTLGKLATDDSLYIEATQAAAALRRVLETLEEDPQKYLKEIRLVDIF